MAVALLSAGAWLTWGLGIALMVTGGIVMVLAIYAAERINE